MVVTKKLGVKLGGSETSQQVLKMKIDDTPRKSPLRSRRCGSPLLEKREKWRTPRLFRSMKKANPHYTLSLEWPTRWPACKSRCLPWSPTLAACEADTSLAISTGHIMC